MSAERIIATLLADSRIAALIGSRWALDQLPQNTAYPAIVYHVITTLPRPNIDYTGRQRADARIQVNLIAPTVDGVISIRNAVQTVFDFMHAVEVNGHHVISLRRQIVGRLMKDSEAGLYMQPVDYLLMFYE